MPFTAKPKQIAPNCGGYYEWLPANYTTSKKYPLLLFFHGLGNLGNGTTELDSITQHGLPFNIKNWGFPYQMIVICPQFGAWPAAEQSAAVLDYALKNYSIDQDKIYLTGLSMGGGATWDLASISDKIAAIAPVCGAAGPNTAGIMNMVKNNVAVWAFHAQNDGIVGVGNTNGWVDGLNSANIKPKAIKTIFPEGGHNIWGAVYDYNYKVNGVDNIYDWLLKFAKTSVPPQLPTSYKITSAIKPIVGWTMDNYYLKGDYQYTDTTVLWGDTRSIANTTEQELYQSEKFGSILNYNFPIQNGKYEVKLHFAELWFNDPNYRIFNVDIQGSRVLTNFDIFKEAGARNVAIQRTFTVDVTNENLSINIKEVKVPNKSKITAIEIYPSKGDNVITTPLAPQPSASKPVSPAPSPTPSCSISSSVTQIPSTNTTYDVSVEIKDPVSSSILKKYLDSFDMPVEVNFRVLPKKK